MPQISHYMDEATAVTAPDLGAIIPYESIPIISIVEIRLSIVRVTFFILPPAHIRPTRAPEIFRFEVEFRIANVHFKVLQMNRPRLAYIFSLLPRVSIAHIFNDQKR